MIYFQNAEVKKRIQVFETGEVRMISEEEVNLAKVDVTKFGNEWKKRKRACMEIVEAICESADLNKKDFMVNIFYDFNHNQKKLQLDIDEDYKVNVNDILSC